MNEEERVLRLDEARKWRDAYVGMHKAEGLPISELILSVFDQRIAILENDRSLNEIRGFIN